MGEGGRLLYIGDTASSLKDAWPFALAILGTPLALLRAYFGMRTNEKRQGMQRLQGNR